MQFPMKIFFFIFEIFPFFQRLFLLSTEDTTIQTNKQTNTNNMTSLNINKKTY